MIFHIAAVDDEMGIGKDDKLLYRLNADQAFFRKMTRGTVMICGRKTYEEMGEARGDRELIVVTGSPIEGQDTARSVTEAIERAKENWPSRDIAVIGGSSIYLHTVDLADRIYLTRIKGIKPADAYYPFEPTKYWTEERLESHSEDGVDYEILSYTKR